MSAAITDTDAAMPSTRAASSSRGAIKARLPSVADFQLVSPENPDLCDFSKSQWYLDPFLAARIVEWALKRFPDKQRLRVLEPSAGRGALALPLRALGHEVTCVDIDHRNAEYLRELGFEVHEGDFLKLSPYTWEPFDLTLMNPPFENGQAEEHILHALKFAPRVVAHAPLTTLSGVDRARGLWRAASLDEQVNHARRPKYSGRKGGGETDMATFGMASALTPQPIASVQMEWWL